MFRLSRGGPNSTVPPPTNRRPLAPCYSAALAETGVAFEINTAGLRKECRELYPAPEFVTMAREAGVPVLIDSDAHAVGDLGAGFAEAVALAKAAGCTHTARFAQRRRSLVPLP